MRSKAVIRHLQKMVRIQGFYLRGESWLLAWCWEDYCYRTSKHWKYPQSHKATLWKRDTRTPAAQNKKFKKPDSYIDEKLDLDQLKILVGTAELYLSSSSQNQLMKVGIYGRIMKYWSPKVNLQRLQTCTSVLKEKSESANKLNIICVNIAPKRYGKRGIWAIWPKRHGKCPKGLRRGIISTCGRGTAWSASVNTS